MAVDTRNKRFSMVGLALAAISVLPNPDGAIDTVNERQQYLWLYSGIDLGAGVVLTPLHAWQVPFEARSRAVPYESRTCPVKAPLT